KAPLRQIVLCLSELNGHFRFSIKKVPCSETAGDLQDGSRKSMRVRPVLASLRFVVHEGRSPGLWSSLAAPSRDIPSDNLQFALTYSGGTAPESHRLPF